MKTPFGAFFLLIDQLAVVHPLKKEYCHFLTSLLKFGRFYN